MSSSPTSFFVEFWDMGGAMSYAKGRGIFYQQANGKNKIIKYFKIFCLGIILVHDVTNRKSHGNLSKWLSEYHQSKTGLY